MSYARKMVLRCLKNVFRNVGTFSWERYLNCSSFQSSGWQFFQCLNDPPTVKFYRGVPTQCSVLSRYFSPTHTNSKGTFLLCVTGHRTRHMAAIYVISFFYYDYWSVMACTECFSIIFSDHPFVDKTIITSLSSNSLTIDWPRTQK